MITRKKRAAVETPVVVEAPVVIETPAAVQHPMLAIPSADASAKPAKKSKRYVAKAQDPRFAPESTITKDAVLASVLPNPKRGLSAERYGRFYAAGLTVQQVIDAYVAAGLTEKLAMDDLRWDTVPHLGKIHLVLEYPAATEAAPVETATVTE